MPPDDATPGTRYHHPLGWYAVSIPPGWRVAGEAEPLRVAGPDDEAVAVIAVTKAPREAPPPRAALGSIAREVPGVTVLERREAEEGEARGMRFARVEELVGARPAWWAFWRTPRVDAHLVTACFSRGPLLATISFEAPSDRVERHRLAAGALIGSFELGDGATPSREEFLGRFLALARRRIPERRVIPVGPLAVTVDGAPLALEQHYRALACEPGLGDAVFDRIFAFLAEGSEALAAGPLRFEEVKGSILLTIKPRGWLDEAERRAPEPARVLRIPFPNDTALIFVVDHLHVMRYIAVEESQRWEVPPKEMFRIARDNLLALKPAPYVRQVLDPFGKLCALAFMEGDGYDAARIVLPGLAERVRERIGERFAVAIPSRDLLIAFSTEDPKVVDAIRRRVEEDVRRKPYPITERFFGLEADGTVAAFQD